MALYFRSTTVSPEAWLAAATMATSRTVLDGQHLFLRRLAKNAKAATTWSSTHRSISSTQPSQQDNSDQLIARKPGYSDPLTGHKLGFEIHMPQYWGATQLKNLAKQYDLSAYEMRIVQERAHKRWQLKKEYQRLAFNPYSTMLKEEGMPFDPAIQRFASMRADVEPYFTPTYKNFLIWAIASFAVPIFMTWITLRDNKVYEARITNGEVSYRERFNLLV